MTITVAKPMAIPRKSRMGRYSRSRASIARTPYDKRGANARTGRTLIRIGCDDLAAHHHHRSYMERTAEREAWNAINSPRPFPARFGRVTVCDRGASAGASEGVTG